MAQGFLPILRRAFGENGYAADKHGGAAGDAGSGQITILPHGEMLELSDRPARLKVQV